MIRAARSEGAGDCSLVDGYVSWKKIDPTMLCQFRWGCRGDLMLSPHLWTPAFAGVTRGQQPSPLKLAAYQSDTGSTPSNLSQVSMHPPGSAGVSPASSPSPSREQTPPLCGNTPSFRPLPYHSSLRSESKVHDPRPDSQRHHYPLLHIPYPLKPPLDIRTTVPYH